MARLCFIAGCLALGIVAFLTLGPISDRPQIAPAHLEHFSAFVLLGCVFALAYPNRFAHAALIVVGSAILLETLQLLTRDRHGTLADATVKIAGAVCGIALARLVLHSWRRVPAVRTAVGRGEQDRL